MQVVCDVCKHLMNIQGHSSVNNKYLPHALEEDVGVEVVYRTGEVLHREGHAVLIAGGKLEQGHIQVLGHVEPQEDGRRRRQLDSPELQFAYQ